MSNTSTIFFLPLIAQFKLVLKILIVWFFSSFKTKKLSFISVISAFFHFKVGSTIKSSNFFFQFISLFLFVIGPLQPCRLSYDSIPFLKALIASIWKFIFRGDLILSPWVYSFSKPYLSLIILLTSSVYEFASLTISIFLFLTLIFFFCNSKYCFLLINLF